MKIQNINITNPIFSNNKQVISKRTQNQTKEQPTQQEQSKQKLPTGTFQRAEDGTFVETKMMSGIPFVQMTKYNWDKQGVLASKEVTSIPVLNPRIAQKTVSDYENNATSNMVITDIMNPNKTVHQSLVTERKDLITGKTVAKETYTMSDVPGIYNVTETDALGRTKVITSAKKTEDGAIYISKNMTSLDGTTTTYRYTQDASGNHIRMFNQIADKEGNILSTVDRTYDRINDKLAKSSINGRHYTIVNQGKEAIVTDELTEERTILNAKDFKMPLYKRPFYALINKFSKHNPKKSTEPVAKNLLKTLPGDTLLNMKEDVRYIVSLKDSLDSAFMSIFGVLKTTDEGFVVNHELGHSMDSLTFEESKEKIQNAVEALKNGEQPKLDFIQCPLADNPQFVKEYIAEKALFVKAFPNFKEEFIDYFIYGVENGPNSRGRQETIAETNAMNSQTPIPPEILAMRTQVLQQYFPRTIAVATKIMTPIAIDDGQNRNQVGDIIIQDKKIYVPEIVVAK